MPVLDDDELPAGKPVRVSVGGADVLLYRHAGGLHAIANRCTDRGGPLHKDKVSDCQVTCPWHLSTFALEDGSVVRDPATAPQPSMTCGRGTAESKFGPRPDAAHVAPAVAGSEERQVGAALGRLRGSTTQHRPGCRSSTERRDRIPSPVRIPVTKPWFISQTTSGCPSAA